MSRRAPARVPPPCAVTAPRTTFAPGDAVLVTDGLSKGARGIVVERWNDVGGWQMWRIDLPDCRDRILRGDFLERVGTDE
jgi:transcription elongation factor